MNQHTKKPNRGAAQRAQHRNSDDADRMLNQHADASQKPRQRANLIRDTNDKLKVTFLGGLEDVGEKNMAVIEYRDTAVILDCGNNLGVDLPGINYEINDTTYLESIRHKLKAYVITHGHLDHIGGLKHIVPAFPAPIYGSRFTIGVVEKAFDDEDLDNDNFKPELVVADIDNHERLKIGEFFVEYVRVTHSLPDAAAISIDTPVGRVIATGDFRLDPEPLDRRPTDITRLKELGEQGVLLLLSDSSYADCEGRVPTESTLQQSFYDIINQAPGRIFVAAFSSNMNRAQMIINAAVADGRKVVLDGRGMLSFAEIAVRQGVLKVPKGTIIPITQASTAPANKLLIMCTGGQGEPNAALQRMSEGQHKYINLEAGDTVVVSSSPIPGNEVRYDQISNRLSRQGLHLFRHPTHELDGSGPLHVSGHAKRDELREMIRFTRPRFLIPVHGGRLRRTYHAELGVHEGIARTNALLPDNGSSLYFTSSTVEVGETVPHGSILVDQNSHEVKGLVVKDRLMLSQEGFMNITLTIDKKSGKLLTSPDIISRGFISLRDNDKLMSELRNELRRAVQQRFKRVDADRFKAEIREHVMHFLYSQTGRSPLVIPTVNLVGKLASDSNIVDTPKREPMATAQRSSKLQTPRNTSEQQRFQEMRSRLLSSH